MSNAVEFGNDGVPDREVESLSIAHVSADPGFVLMRHDNAQGLPIGVTTANDLRVWIDRPRLELPRVAVGFFGRRGYVKAKLLDLGDLHSLFTSLPRSLPSERPRSEPNS